MFHCRGGQVSAANLQWQAGYKGGNNNQLWKTTALGGGRYRDTYGTTGLALDGGRAAGNGSPAKQHTVVDGPNLEWRFARV